MRQVRRRDDRCDAETEEREREGLATVAVLAWDGPQNGLADCIGAGSLNSRHAGKILPDEQADERYKACCRSRGGVVDTLQGVMRERGQTRQLDLVSIKGSDSRHHEIVAS